MQNLLRAIPSKEEYSAMGEEQRELLFFTLRDAVLAHNLPKVDTEYHPEEIMAIMAGKCPYLLDLVMEFDLTVDYNG